MSGVSTLLTTMSRFSSCGKSRWLLPSAFSMRFVSVVSVVSLCELVHHKRSCSGNASHSRTAPLVIRRWSTGQEIQHQLPPPIHKCRLNDFIIRDSRVGLHNGCKG